MYKGVGDIFEKDFGKLKLSEHSRKSDFEGSFYEHLNGLIAFEYVEKNDVKKREHFTFNDYMGLEQYVLTANHKLEIKTPMEIDWRQIDNIRDKIYEVLKRVLGYEKNSDTLKPILKFTVNSIENLFVYKMMYPTSNLNPWIHTRQILEKGYLFLASDDEALLKEFKKDIYASGGVIDKNNIGLVTKSKKQSDKSAGFLVDSRFKLHRIVKDILMDKAPHFEHAINTKRILRYLEKQGEKGIGSSYLYNSTLLPLKRAGIIGSSITGYFYISSEDDLKVSYNFHISKINSMKVTLRNFEVRATEMGFSDFMNKVKE